MPIASPARPRTATAPARAARRARWQPGNVPLQLLLSVSLAACDGAPKDDADRIARVIFEVPGKPHVGNVKKQVDRMVATYGHVLVLNASDSLPTGDKIRFVVDAHGKASYDILNEERGGKLLVAVFSGSDSWYWKTVACQIYVELSTVRPNVRQIRGKVTTEEILKSCVPVASPGA